mmetsp:Transcript_17404/g.51191  ORF Transcript_17404/g.51191 Transcript_17404/m.51191 type:complete len:227 (+) Transcript_17404:657-1337(+)
MHAPPPFLKFAGNCSWQLSVTGKIWELTTVPCSKTSRRNGSQLAPSGPRRVIWTERPPPMMAAFSRAKIRRERLKRTTEILPSNSHTGCRNVRASLQPACVPLRRTDSSSVAVQALLRFGREGSPCPRRKGSGITARRIPFSGSFTWVRSRPPNATSVEALAWPSASQRKAALCERPNVFRSARTGLPKACAPCATRTMLSHGKRRRACTFRPRPRKSVFLLKRRV